MNSNRPASWVCLLAQSRPALSALSVLATVAIACQAHRPPAGYEYSGETDYAVEEELLAPTVIRTSDVHEALDVNVTVREWSGVLAADQRYHNVTWDSHAAPVRLSPMPVDDIHDEL